MKKNMKRISFIFSVCLFMFTTACAQKWQEDTIQVPESFVNTQYNTIENPQAIGRFFEDMYNGEKIVRVMQLGDSHVRSNLYPMTVRRELERFFATDATTDDNYTYATGDNLTATETGNPGISYSSHGKNGLQAFQAAKPEHIEATVRTKPQLIIVCLGSNDAYAIDTISYKPARQMSQLTTLMENLKEASPEGTEFILCTMPGLYYSKPGTKVYRDCPNMVHSANVIRQYARENNIALWDCFKVCGEEEAHKNWWNAGYMRPDHVHLNPNGYNLLSRLLAQAIERSFLDFVNAKEEKQQ